MRSNAIARSPSSSFPVVDHRLVEAAAGDSLGRALEPQDPLRVQRCQQVARDDGGRAGRSGSQKRSRRSISFRLEIGSASESLSRITTPSFSSGDRHLGEAAASPVDGSALEHAIARRPPRDRIAGDVERRRGVRVAEDERLVLQDRVNNDPGLEDGGGPLRKLLLTADLRGVVARHGLCVLLQLVELRVRRAPLERGTTIR
jgi:hypothetical protein